MIIRFFSGLLVMTALMAFLACSQQPGDNGSSGSSSSSAGTSSSSTGGSSSAGTSSSAGQKITISGTITLPAPQIGKLYLIDFDTNSGSGSVSNIAGFTSGSTISYSVGNLPAGDYMFMGWVDVDGSTSVNSGDYMSFFPGLASTTNLTADSTIDFTLATY